MYTAYYGLFEKPFSLSPDPRYLFFSDGHREALAHMRYGIEQGEGFIAVTGEVGTGKSTICRALIEGFGEETELAFLFNPPRSATELLQAIAFEFGLDPVSGRRHKLNDQLNRFLLDRKSQGRRVLLIIDEAQNLDVTVLEEIRLLSNLETASSKLIQIILLGQPELDRKLDSRELRQLRQRISVRWFLMPLSAEETRDYVAHRIGIAAGEKREIFDPQSLKEIYRLSGGIPRRINLLADRSLLAGYTESATHIGRGIVRTAAREIDGGMPPVRRGFRISERAQKVAAGIVMFFSAAVLGNFVAGSELFREFISLRSTADSALVAVSTARSDAQPRSASNAKFELLEAVVSENTSIDEPVSAVLFGADENAANEPDGDDQIRIIGEGPVGTRTERLLNTLAPGSFLGRLLDSRDPDYAREAAVEAIFESFDTSSEGVDDWELPLDDEEAVALLESRGLNVVRILDSSLEELRELNHPVMLVLSTEQGDVRTVALHSLDESRASLIGVTDFDPLAVSVREVENQWDGEAMVVWEKFEDLPNVLSLGNEGRDVVWLQVALSELGLYKGSATGKFDDSTLRSVRTLQEGAMLPPDGAVGPRTQMVLYSKLPRYQVPRLQEKDGAG